MLPELLCELRADRNSSLPRVGLRGVYFAPNERLTDPQERSRGVGKVNVLPAKAKNLTASEAGTYDGQENDARLLKPVPPARLLG